jgi:hypothetical protein
MDRLTSENVYGANESPENLNKIKSAIQTLIYELSHFVTIDNERESNETFSPALAYLVHVFISHLISVTLLCSANFGHLTPKYNTLNIVIRLK